MKKQSRLRPRASRLLMVMATVAVMAAFGSAAARAEAKIAETPSIRLYTQPIAGLGDPRIVSVIILFSILAASTALGSGISAWILRRRISVQHEELESASARLQSMDASQDAVLRAMPDLIFIYDTEARFIGYMTSDLGRFAVPPEQFLGKNNSELFGAREYHEKTLTAIRRALAGEGVQVFEYELREAIPGQLFEARIVRLEEGKALSINRNITERRKIEEIKDSSLREKEALLKEIHHRVKNNMQIISSLLAMQSGMARDDYDKDLFIESQGRIRAMAAVHDQLYRSKDFTSIPAAEYLADLVADIEASWSQPDRSIRVSLDVDDSSLELDRAVPLGLIINELATNSFKYAFAPGASGTITVSLRRTGDRMVSLVVADDGHGFPEGFDTAADGSGMGYTIINALVQQIGGSIETAVPAGGGSEVRIVVPQPAVQSAVAVQA